MHHCNRAESGGSEHRVEGSKICSIHCQTDFSSHCKEAMSMNYGTRKEA